MFYDCGNKDISDFIESKNNDCVYIKLLTKDFKVISFIMSSDTGCKLKEKFSEIKKDTSAYGSNWKNIAISYKKEYDEIKLKYYCINCKDDEEKGFNLLQEISRWGIKYKSSDNNDIEINDCKRIKYLSLYNKPASYPQNVIAINSLDKNLGNNDNKRFPIIIWSQTNDKNIFLDIYRSDNSNYSDYYNCIKENYNNIFLVYLNSENIIKNEFVSIIEYKKLPQKKQIINSFINLLKDDFEDPETTISLRTEWLASLSLILSYSYKIFKKTNESILSEKNTSLVIIGKNGKFRSAIISSLLQIFHDKYYRTIDGLNVLIEKEFNYLGFYFNNGNENNKNNHSLFILFLDCLYQLVNIFTDEFEYNQMFIVFLMKRLYDNKFDSFLTNFYDNFSKLRSEKSTLSVWMEVNDNKFIFCNSNFSFNIYKDKFSKFPIKDCEIFCLNNMKFNSDYYCKWTDIYSKRLRSTIKMLIKQDFEYLTESMKESKIFDCLSDKKNENEMETFSKDDNIKENELIFNNFNSFKFIEDIKKYLLLKLEESLSNFNDKNIKDKNRILHEFIKDKFSLLKKVIEGISLKFTRYMVLLLDNWCFENNKNELYICFLKVKEMQVEIINLMADEIIKFKEEIENSKEYNNRIRDKDSIVIEKNELNISQDKISTYFDS